MCNIYNTSSDVYSNYRKEIEHEFYNTKDYDKCLELNCTFLRILKDSEKEVNDYNFWFSYMTFSKIDIKNKRYKHAIKNIRTALSYQVPRANYFTTIWLLAQSFEEVNIKKAIKYHTQCFDYYVRINHEEYATYERINIGKLKRDTEMIEEAIEYYKEIEIENNPTITKQNMIDEMYKELFHTYVAKNEIFKANGILHNIKDINLKNQLKKSCISCSNM